MAHFKMTSGGNPRPGDAERPLKSSVPSESAQERARRLLEDWKNRSAALKLKIYHLEQGM